MVVSRIGSDLAPKSRAQITRVPCADLGERIRTPRRLSQQLEISTHHQYIAQPRQRGSSVLRNRAYAYARLAPNADAAWARRLRPQWQARQPPRRLTRSHDGSPPWPSSASSPPLPRRRLQRSFAKDLRTGDCEPAVTVPPSANTPEVMTSGVANACRSRPGTAQRRTPRLACRVLVGDSTAELLAAFGKRCEVSRHLRMTQPCPQASES